MCSSDLDRVDATPARAAEDRCPWDADAQALLDELVGREPVLVQISAAKRLRDRAERDARAAGELRVTLPRMQRTRDAVRQGVAA